jgi:PEP-CTERM motif
MKKLILVAALAALTGLIASADPVCPANETLVNVTVALGTTYNAPSSANCTVNGIDFSNFSFYPGAGWTNGENMDVTLSVAGGILNFSVNQTAGQDLQMIYEITPGISAMTLSSGPGAGVGVNEGVCSISQVLPGGACNGTNLGQGSVTGGQTTTFSIATSPTGVDWIFKDVNGTSDFTQSVVPEPMTLSLMGLGFLGIGLLRKKLKR